MSIVIKNQVDASDRSADQIGAELRGDHQFAILCYDVQELTQSVVELQKGVRRDILRWQDSAASAQGMPESDAVGDEWETVLKKLLGVFEKTNGLINSMESHGFSVDGKSHFLASWRELRGVVCFARDRVALSFQQLNEGRTRPLGEIADELRNQAH